MPVRTTVNGFFAVSGKLLMPSDAEMWTFLNLKPSFSAALGEILKIKF